MWALERLDDCTKQDGLGPQYTRMKASWAGVEALASAVWLLWMARYTEYSMIFPDVTEGGSQVRWAPSGLCGGTVDDYYQVAESGRQGQLVAQPGKERRERGFDCRVCLPC